MPALPFTVYSEWLKSALIDVNMPSITAFDGCPAFGFGLVTGEGRHVPFNTLIDPFLPVAQDPRCLAEHQGVRRLKDHSRALLVVFLAWGSQAITGGFPPR